ncbi:glutathione S-transferase family protein [Pseudorhodobacter turbinis]|uniref:Glutathione S-transferase family protein n=2 Tax=Pseudorhodobacter turbinis TaxID=2500533 RepID=A0A4P8EHQ4_9RHOB|nr:glutathione S-transferase family protein [Pseudorhodobacter turbinis]
MLTLYSVPHSLYCAKTRILLRAKGLTWQEHTPADDPDGFASASPFGNLPAITRDDFALSDSEAIAEYIDEAFPAPPLLSADITARARMRERARFHDTRLEPAVRALFPLVTTPNPEAAAQAVAAIAKRLEQLVVLLTQPLPFGLGDCGFAPTFLWIDLLTQDTGQTLVWPAPVVAYRARLQEVPAVAAEMADYSRHAGEWVAEKQALRRA